MRAYVNGAVVPADQASVSIFDRGFLYGDGVFETMRTYGGRVFKLEEHLERLERSAAGIRLELPLDRRALARAVVDTVDANALEGEALVRLTVSRGASGEGLFPVVAVRPTIVVAVKPLDPYPPETYQRGWKVIIANVRRNDPAALSPSVKSLNYLNNVMARAEATAAGANEALLLNGRGLVTEGTVSNFFAVRDGSVVTAPESDGVLAGITREIALELAAAARVAAAERSLSPDDVYTADEAFLTFTSAGIVPVVSVDGRNIGDGTPGPVTRRLIGLYEEYTRRW